MIDGTTALLEETSAVQQDCALAWERFPGNDCVREWAAEMRRARVASDAELWKLAGRAIVLLTEDEALCTALLLRVAADAGMQFVNVALDDVADFVARENPQEGAPAIAYLEPGRWTKGKSDRDDADVASEKAKVQSAIASAIATFDPAHPVIFVTSAEDIRSLAMNLRSPGTFDRFLRVQSPKAEALGEDIIDRIGRDRCAVSVTQVPGKVGMLFTRDYSDDRRRDLALLRLRRLIARAGRPLEFLDLVHVALHGFSESDRLPDEPEQVRRQTAVHEAGHAVVAIIGSNGRNIPECSSIIPSVHYSGVVVDSLQYLMETGDQVTYADMRQRVRILLAGRAAEEMGFGAEHVSNGAREDLKRATIQAGIAFSFWGFAPAMERDGQAGSNLAVAGIDDDPFTASEEARVEGLVREFLCTEYGEVKQMLEAHRPLMDAVTDRLLRDAMLDQEGLAEVVRAHGPAGLIPPGPVGAAE